MNTCYSHNKIITNNLLSQQYTVKLMLGICNIKDLVFVLLKSKSILFVCLLLDMMDQMLFFIFFYFKVLWVYL